MGAPLELIRELDSSIAHSTDQRRSVMLGISPICFWWALTSIPQMKST